MAVRGYEPVPRPYLDLLKLRVLARPPFGPLDRAGIIAALGECDIAKTAFAIEEEATIGLHEATIRGRALNG
jgi:hypothetical protein